MRFGIAVLGLVPLACGTAGGTQPTDDGWTKDTVDVEMADDQVVDAGPDASCDHWTLGDGMELDQAAALDSGPLDPGVQDADNGIEDTDQGDAFQVAQTIGGERPAKVFVPSDYDPSRAWPLLVLLHGYGVNGIVQDAYLGVSARVDEMGFIEVLPEGTTDETGHQFWNASPSEGGGPFVQVDDVAYLRGLILEAMDTFNVDPERVVILGHSNGAYMAYRMACEASDLVTTVGAIAGSIFGGVGTCMPQGPVSVLHMHGTADGAVPYDGGTMWGMESPGVDELMDYWLEVDGCKGGTGWTADFDLNVAGQETEGTTWTGCEHDSFVELWSMDGTGHIPAFTAEAKDKMLTRLLSVPDTGR